MEESQHEKEVSRAEKILALALAVFLLVGGLRLAAGIEAAFPRPDLSGMYKALRLDEREREVSLIREKESELADALRQRQEAEARARLEYELAREEYRTFLDRGVDDPARRAQWEQKREAFEREKAAREKVERDLKTFQVRILEPKKRELERLQAQFDEEVARLNRARDLKAGAASLGYALGAFALSFLVFNFFRRSSVLRRYAVIGTSFLGFGAVQAFLVSLWIAYPFLVGAVPVEAIVSVGGSAVCVASLVYLKNRFFSAQAVRNRRLWKGACPACGFPAPGAFCPWCGAEQSVACPGCGTETGRFLPYCRACGRPLTQGDERFARSG